MAWKWSMRLSLKFVTYHALGILTCQRRTAGRWAKSTGPSRLMPRSERSMAKCFCRLKVGRSLRGMYSTLLI